MLDISSSSSSSKSTFTFEITSNLNQNANDNDKSLHRLVQSSTDLYLSLNEENCLRKNRAIRIESAIMTSDYSHLLNHSIKYPSQSIMNMNMNRTIDLIKRNGAGDENLSSQFNNKQVQTSIITDHNHYLTLEHVPIYNRQKIQFTSKQLILISISVFVLVILLCLFFNVIV
jgi:predicted RND superfamily exporter protein